MAEDRSVPFLKEAVLLLIGAVLAIGGNWAANRLSSYSSDLEAVVRFGRTPPTTSGQPDAGFFDLTITNNGDKKATGVWVDVPQIQRAWVSRGGKAAAWLEPESGRLQLGEVGSKDAVHVFAIVPNPPNEGSAEAIVLSQDEGGSGRVRRFVWMRVPDATWGEMGLLFAILGAFVVALAVASNIARAKGYLIPKVVTKTQTTWVWRRTKQPDDGAPPAA